MKQAHEAWQIATELGFKMTLLDIGGGFPGQANAPITFTEVIAPCFLVGYISVALVQL